MKAELQRGRMRGKKITGCGWDYGMSTGPTISSWKYR